MPIDRALWNSPFLKLPTWLCPTCQNGRLKEKPNSIKTEESGPSKRLQKEDDWEPDWVQERFAGLIYCDNIECGEVCSISGTSGTSYIIEEDIDGSPEQILASTLIIKSVYPPPHMFVLPSKCPHAVNFRLVEAFGLVWTDINSSANKFRMAVEALMTNQKIPSYNKPAPGKKRTKIALHHRIEKYRAKNKDVADLLEAIKWLGNYGSHENGGLSLEDVLVAADLLEHSLQLIFDKKPSPLATAKKINKKKGPIN